MQQAIYTIYKKNFVVKISFSDNSLYNKKLRKYELMA